MSVPGPHVEYHYCSATTSLSAYSTRMGLATRDYRETGPEMQEAACGVYQPE